MDVEDDPQEAVTPEKYSQVLADAPVVPEDHPAITCMIKKAHQIAEIQWTPLRQIPTLSDSWLPGGTTMYGIPYSSVKEKDKFVGQEVSFYTFMSAVHNSRSVIYTEDVKVSPYQGVNCGIYYGTVCSMAVNYALGIERPIESKMYATHPLFAEVKRQDVNNIFPGDVLWSKGHVVLLLSIQKDDIGNPQSFSILESSGNTRIKHYSVSDFIKRWEKNGWIAYRYLKLEENTNYTPLPFVHLNGDSECVPRYNDDLCTSRGDHVCFREGEDVVVNVLSSSYQTMSINREQSEFQSLLINAEDVTLSGLPYGHYRVRLENSAKSSEEISFEMVDTRVYVHDGKSVHFSSLNAVPEYYVICDIKGDRELIRDISDQERKKGCFILDADYSGYFLKVFFKGEYGRVSNDPIKL